MKLKLRTLFVGLLVGGGVVAQSSFARMISDISFHYSGSECIKAKVQFEKGTAGDDHVLYVVWDDVDRGIKLSDWPSGNVVRYPVADDATSVDVVLPKEASATAFYRAFLAKAKRTGYKYDKLISAIRSEGGAYINTGHFCTRDCEIFLDFTYPRSVSGCKYFLGACQLYEKFSIRLYIRDWRWYLDRSGGNKYVSSSGTGVINQSARTKITMSSYKGFFRCQDKVIDWSYYTEGVTEASTWPLALFATSTDEAGNVSDIIDVGVIYGASIKEKDQYVRRMQPAIKDGIAGLWDAVNDEFYQSPDSENPFLSTETETETERVDYPEVSFDDAFADFVVPGEKEAVSYTSRAYRISNRAVTSVSFGDRPEGSRVTVGMTTGKSGDVDVAYLAWGDKDYGADSAAWPNMTRLGALSAGETSRSFSITNEMDGTEFYRVFLATAWHPIVPKALSYIRSEGNAYIDTGYNCATNTRVIVDFQFPDSAGKNGDYFGVSSTGTDYGFRVVKLSNQNRVIDICTIKQSTGKTEWNTYLEIGLSYNYRVKMETVAGWFSAQYTTNGITYGTASKTSIGEIGTKGFTRATLPLYIFASSQDSGVPLNVMPWGNLFGASIQEDGVFKRQFYPCVKDGVAGLCDQVENKFYPSLGEADFLATDSSGAAIAEGAFPVETPFTSSATVVGEYRKGFSVIVR